MIKSEMIILNNGAKNLLADKEKDLDADKHMLHMIEQYKLICETLLENNLVTE